MDFALRPKLLGKRSLNSVDALVNGVTYNVYQPCYWIKCLFEYTWYLIEFRAPTAPTVTDKGEEFNKINFVNRLFFMFYRCLYSLINSLRTGCSSRSLSSIICGWRVFQLQSTTYKRFIVWKSKIPPLCLSCGYLPSTSLLDWPEVKISVLMGHRLLHVIRCIFWISTVLECNQATQICEEDPRLGCAPPSRGGETYFCCICTGQLSPRWLNPEN